MLRRRPVTGGGAAASTASAVETSDFAVLGRLDLVDLLRKKLRFFLIVFRLSAFSSCRMDSAIVECAVRTVRRRSSGSTASFSSSMSMSSGSGCRRKKEDMCGDYEALLVVERPESQHGMSTA